MTNIEITYDEKTGYYDALVLEKGIATQGKSLDELIKNLTESFSFKIQKQLKNFNNSKT